MQRCPIEMVNISYGCLPLAENGFHTFNVSILAIIQYSRVRWDNSSEVFGELEAIKGARHAGVSLISNPHLDKQFRWAENQTCLKPLFDKIFFGASLLA